MAYWVHYTGGYISYGEEPIHKQGAKLFNKNEFIKIDHIANLGSDKFVKKIQYFAYDLLGEMPYSENIFRIHLANPIILNYTQDLWDAYLDDLSKEQIANIKLEHLFNIDRYEAKFIRACEKERVEKEAIISDFESRVGVPYVEDSPVEFEGLDSLFDTGDSESIEDDFDLDDLGFEDDDEDDEDFDVVQFDTEPSTTTKINKQSNNLTLF